MVDIAPVDYRPSAHGGGHLALIDAMRAVDLRAIANRRQLDAALAAGIRDVATRQFIAQNARRGDVVAGGMGDRTGVGGGMGDNGIGGGSDVVAGGMGDRTGVGGGMGDNGIGGGSDVVAGGMGDRTGVGGGMGDNGIGGGSDGVAGGMGDRTGVGGGVGDSGVGGSMGDNGGGDNADGAPNAAGARYRWQLNLEVIARHLPALADYENSRVTDIDALFIKGGRSDYICAAHQPEIFRRFPRARLAEIAEAGHWLHAEHPTRLAALCADFLD